MSASGKIQPKKPVNISAETMGKVVNLDGRRGRDGQEGPAAAADRPAQPRDGGAEPRGQPGLGHGRSSNRRKAQIENSQGRAAAGRRTRCGGRKTVRRPACSPRETYERAQNDVKMRETDLQRQRAVGPARRSSASSRKRRTSSSAQLRPEQGAHRLADRRPRHPPQHRRGRNGRRRHDEQRRHGAADDRRHVGHRDRDRGGRNRHPVHQDRPAREGHDRRDSRQDVSRARSPRSATARFRRPARAQHGPRDELQGRRHDRRRRCRTCGPASRARRSITTGHAQEGARRADSGDDACASWSSTTKGKIVPADAAGPGRGADAVRAPARPSSSPARRARKSRACSSCEDGRAHVRAGQDRHRGREVLRGRSTGLKEGDEVITGPFASVRNLKEGDAVKVSTRAGARPIAERPDGRLHDSSSKRSAIALQAIWANKLRSLLTVLGNIVAVTSIIAVVSLVQGLNATRDGRDPVAVRAPTRSPCQRTRPDAHRRRELRAQSNPRVTLDDADAIRDVRRRASAGDGRSRARARQIKYRGESLDSVADPRRHQGIQQHARRRRSSAAGRSRRASSTPGGSVADPRLGHGRPAVRRDRSDRQGRSRSAASTSASSASRRRRARSSASRRTSSPCPARGVPAHVRLAAVAAS